MIETTNKLEALLILTKEYISKSSDAELNLKASPEKWSKKEIIGHLIDAGIYNLQRFTEIQYEKEPMYNEFRLDLSYVQKLVSGMSDRFYIDASTSTHFATFYLFKRPQVYERIQDKHLWM